LKRIYIIKTQNIITIGKITRSRGITCHIFFFLFFIIAETNKKKKLIHYKKFKLRMTTREAPHAKKAQKLLNSQLRGYYSNFSSDTISADCMEELIHFLTLFIRNDVPNHTTLQQQLKKNVSPECFQQIYTFLTSFWVRDSDKKKLVYYAIFKATTKDELISTIYGILKTKLLTLYPEIQDDIKTSEELASNNHEVVPPMVSLFPYILLYKKKIGGGGGGGGKAKKRGQVQVAGGGDQQSDSSTSTQTTVADLEQQQKQQQQQNQQKQQQNQQQQPKKRVKRVSWKQQQGDGGGGGNAV
jgi:hypothetical protein